MNAGIATDQKEKKKRKKKHNPCAGHTVEEEDHVLSYGYLEAAWPDRSNTVGPKFVADLPGMPFPAPGSIMAQRKCEISSELAGILGGMAQHPGRSYPGLFFEGENKGHWGRRSRSFPLFLFSLISDTRPRTRTHELYEPHELYTPEFARPGWSLVISAYDFLFPYISILIDSD